jgi:hypothetical protein
MARIILGLAALLVLAFGVSPLRACINDRAVKQAEREFRSQYHEEAPDSSSYDQPSASWSQFTSASFYGGGAVLMLGATVTVLVPRKRS